MQRFANNKSLLSGSELHYDAEYWNNLMNMDKLNCYDYAFGNANQHQTEFSQPLDIPPTDSLYTCPNVEAGMMAENPNTKKTTFEEQCAPGERKIALMVDPIHPSDYHYMRQDADGVWSHKPGYLQVRRVDASGQVIFAPHLSDRKYPDFNYTNMCGYYCIPGSVNSAR